MSTKNSTSTSVEVTLPCSVFDLTAALTNAAGRHVGDATITFARAAYVGDVVRFYVHVSDEEHDGSVS